MIKSKYKSITLFIIVIGVFVRLFGIGRLPVGLNCDEASSAYDAFSILKTLADRNGNFLPVYMLAWGSGQSALLTYLMIPFIAMFGLSLFAIRLPMAIISIISLVVFCKIMDLTELDDKSKLFSILFFVLMPWHIMKSRWGLDCNLLPDFVLYAVYFLARYLNKGNKRRDLVLGFVFLSISAYSYATSFLGLFVFCIVFYIYGIKSKVLNFKEILVSMLVTLFITWPLILFVVVNLFDMSSIILPFMTIPRLRINRMSSETVFASKNMFSLMLSSLIETVKLLIVQFDKLYWNSIKGIGIYYLFSFPIFIIGFLSYIKNVFNSKKKIDDVFAIWLLAGFILCICLKNIYINKINFVIIPVFYFIIKGFFVLFRYRVIYIISLILVIISFAQFSYRYIDANVKKANNILIKDINTTEYDCFVVDIEQALKYADKLDVEEIRLGGACAEPYIYVLFYLKENPRNFRKTRRFANNNKAQIVSYGKWNFGVIDGIEKDDRIAYLLDVRNIDIIDKNHFKISDFGRFIVVEANNEPIKGKNSDK